jgi:hypothetical protein
MTSPRADAESGRVLFAFAGEHAGYEAARPTFWPGTPVARSQARKPGDRRLVARQILGRPPA